MVLGLDLSSVNSGYSIMDPDGSLIAFGSIIPRKTMSHSEKLQFIYNRVDVLIQEYHVTDVVIEDQHLRSNVNTLKLLSRIGGVAMLSAQQHGASVTLYPATTIKLTFTGNGKADKSQMINRAIELYNIQRHSIDDNIADAIGVAYTYVSKAGNSK